MLHSVRSPRIKHVVAVRARVSRLCPSDRSSAQVVACGHKSLVVVHSGHLQNHNNAHCPPDAAGCDRRRPRRIDHWLGLRYATAARFEPPEEVAAWDGVLDATAFAPSCPQLANVERSPTMSEDCLAVNIWLPEGRPPPKRAVVFIHGGGFVTGSIGPMYEGNFLYNGSSFAARHGVAVATLQHRLGPFGYLARGGGGNLALRDMQAALKFVRRVLAPGASSIVLFGHSSGAANACALLASPHGVGAGTESARLFDAALLMSGSCVSLSPPHTSRTRARRCALASTMA